MSNEVLSVYIMWLERWSMYIQMHGKVIQYLRVKIAEYLYKNDSFYMYVENKRMFNIGLCARKRYQRLNYVIWKSLVINSQIIH